MLKTLIATLTNDLSRPKYNRGCQTKIDPELTYKSPPAKG